MTQQEFTNRVGEQYANEFTHAEALYMALPNTDKDTFCALWKLEKETGLTIFAELRRLVSAYNTEKEESAIFAACCRPMMGVFLPCRFSLTCKFSRPPLPAFPNTPHTASDFIKG